VKPESILLLTFTAGTAQRMLRRATILLDSRCEKVPEARSTPSPTGCCGSTRPQWGSTRRFTICTRGRGGCGEPAADQMRLDTGERRFPAQADPVRHLLKPSTPSSHQELLAEEYPHFEMHLEDILKLQSAYEVYKAKHNLMDYDDLLIFLGDPQDHDRIRLRRCPRGTRI